MYSISQKYAGNPAGDLPAIPVPLGPAVRQCQPGIPFSESAPVFLCYTTYFLFL